MNMLLKAAAGAMIALLMVAAYFMLLVINVNIAEYLFDDPSLAVGAFCALLIVQFGALLGATA